MTDDIPQLVQRLCDESLWFGSRKWGDVGFRQHGEAATEIMAHAATAIDTLTRALAEQQDLSERRRVSLVEMGNEAEAQFNRAEQAESTLTAAVREARAETWTQAADEICNNRENGGVLYDVVELMRQRATASRAADPTAGQRWPNS